MSETLSVAFCCLGNICRSPMGEAVFKNIVKEKGLETRFRAIDSFGTGQFHIGDSPDTRTVQVCKNHGIPVNHKAQQIGPSDFDRYDYIFAMDENNYTTLKSRAPKSSRASIVLIGDFCTDTRFGKIVEDPYYGDLDGFEYCYQQLTHFSKTFLEQKLGVKFN